MIQISQGVKGMSELGLRANSLAAGTVHLYLPGQVDTAVAPMYSVYIERDSEMSRRGRDENDTADTPNLSMRTKIEMV